jgi:hypothetical protein
VIARAVVYLGYRLPPDDEYLHQEIETLSTMFGDRGPHRLLIPAKNARHARPSSEPSSRLALASTRLTPVAGTRPSIKQPC